MPSLQDVAGICAGLPGTVEDQRRGERTWQVGGKTFAWERSFSKADIKRYGADPVPAGTILAVNVDDLGEKDAVLAAGVPGIFTISHFDGYAAVLIELDVISAAALREALVDGWLTRAPKPLRDQFLTDS